MSQSSPQRILFLSWKDILHPAAGGAEIYTDALATHMAKTHEVTYFTSRFPGSSKSEQHHGYIIIRKGNIVTTILYAWIYWHINIFRQSYSLIVDQVHGVPFFTNFYIRRPQSITLIYEVAGVLWSRILPMNVGLLLDALWLRMYKNRMFATISNSTQQELIAHHIPSHNIHILPLFVSQAYSVIPQKHSPIHIVILGRIAPVKRIEHAIEAFKILQRHIPTIKLIIAGKYESTYSEYSKKIERMIAHNPSITLIYNCSEEQKKDLLQQSHLLCMPSEKEGYGIVILEAAACGTPAVGYNVPGIRDAIQHTITGMISMKETPEELATSMLDILTTPDRYQGFQRAAFAFAKQHDLSNTLKSWDAILTTAL